MFLTPKRMYCSHFSMLQICNDCKYFVTGYCRQHNRLGRQGMDLLNISYTEESSVLAESEVSLSYDVEERPAEDVLVCNESETLSAYFEESVPGPSTTVTINSDTTIQSVNTTQSNTTTHPGTDYNNNTNRDKKIRCCSKCDYKTTDTGNFSRHQKVHQDSRIKHECDTCGKSYSALYDLKEHVKTVHGNDKLLCESCPFSCRSRKTLFRHRSMEHSANAKSYTCLYCNKIFLEKEHYHGHINGHTGMRPYDCPTCKKTFKFKHHLTRHMLVCSGNYGEKFKCDICNVCLKSSSSLKDHKDGKHGQNIKVCPCGKMFSWRVSFIRHSKVCKYKN